MTSSANNRLKEQHTHRHSNDGNTSDDSLLLMANDNQDRAPLLRDVEYEAADREVDLSTRSRTQSTHCHVPDNKFDYGSRNRLILVLIICIIFMGIEIAGRWSGDEYLLENTRIDGIVTICIGGFLSNSTAVITDAAHMAIDVASFVISITAMYLATKRPTQRLSFGYIRAGCLSRYISTTWSTRFSSARGTRSSAQCVDYLVGDGCSRLFGHWTLHQSKFRSETNGNDHCCLLRRRIQYCVGNTYGRCDHGKANTFVLFSSFL